MPRSFEPYQKKHHSPSFWKLFQPLKKILPETPALQSRGDRPLQMNFEDQLKALIFFHLEEHVSARHLIQVLKEDQFARVNIAPKDGIGKSSFSEAINNRGLEQLQSVFEKLSNEASNILPRKYVDLGELVAELLGLDLVELLGEAAEEVGELLGLEAGDDEVAGADGGFAEEQGGVDPGALDDGLDVCGDVGHDILFCGFSNVI